MEASNPPISFAAYKKQHLSKVYTYTDESKKTFYFYFYRGKRTDYHQLANFKKLMDEFEKDEQELIKEYKKLYKPN
jgi:hypothetical protein